MNLSAILRRDVAGRRKLIAESQQLIARWERELANLHNHPPPVEHHIPLPRAGVDYSYGRPQPQTLRRAGVTFVGRYLGGDAAKDLSHVEAENLAGAGLDVILFFESTANRSLDGYAAGAADARQAESQLHQIGLPNAAVYFTVDFDAQWGDLPEIDSYFKGAGDHLGHPRVGVYGGIRVVSHLLANGLARYGCQTTAWSGGQWSPRAQVRQNVVSVQGNEIVIGGVSVDRLEAVAADFGQVKL